MKKIELFKVFMHDNVPEAVGKTLLSGFIGQGDQVEDFEEVLRKHFGHPWVNTVNSATSGLQLAVHMAKGQGLPADSEVLTTPLTCTATNFAITAENLRLRWVDVNPRTCNVDTDDLARKITHKTAAIMVVHWGGYACDLERIKEIQNNCYLLYGWSPPVIEDCAHAWGATYQGRLLGTHGNAAVFSFQAIKHLTTGDGGCLLSPNEADHQRTKLLRWYGLDRNATADFRCQQNIKEWGFKFHMNNIAATIGLGNYPHIGALLKINRENGRYYNKTLAEIPGVTLMEDAEDRESSYWIYSLRVENRADFVRKMTENNIMVSQVHDRNDKHDCLKQYRCQLPNLDTLAKEMICLPCGWWVTPEDRERIVDCIQRGW